MSLSFFDFVLQRLSPRWSLLIYAATWTAILTVLVAIASFSPEMAFVWAINPTSSFSLGCHSNRKSDDGLFVRVPLDFPGEVFCFPAENFKRSKMDLIVPPVFAAIIVATSAYAVKALALWEVDDVDEPQQHHQEDHGCVCFKICWKLELKFLSFFTVYAPFF